MIRLPEIDNRSLRMLAGLTLGIVAAFLIAFNALLLWVATGPRSLARLSPYIEATFRADDGSYSVHIGETWLIWDGWLHPIDIRLRDIAINNKDGQLVSSFPEISLGVDIWSLPLGRILPTSISITKPVISLFQNEDRSISLGFKNESNTGPSVPFSVAIAPLIDSDSNKKLRELRFVNIVNADVSVGSVKKGVFFQATNTDIMFRRSRRGVVQAFTKAKISYADYSSLIDAQLTIKKDSPTIDGELTVSRLMPGVLSSLFFESSAISNLQLPVSGHSSFSFNRDGSLKKLAFKVDGGKGSIVSEKLDGDVPVRMLHAEGVVAENGDDVQIDQFVADVDGMPVTAKGRALFTNGKPAIQAEMSIKNVPVKKAHMFWPPSLSPQSREWIMTNITGGVVPQATAHINIASADWLQPLLPRQAIDANIGLEGATIRYLPEHPPVTSLKGTVHVDALSLEANIASADCLKESKLSEGLLLIDDLNADNPYIKLHFNASSTARDIVQLLGLPRLEHARHLNLDADTAGGTATGHASLGFHFFAPLGAKGKPVDDDISYDVVAEAHGISQAGFMRKFDISNAEGTLTVNSKSVEFRGSGNVNGATANAAVVKYVFQPEGEFDTFIDVGATTPVEALPRFGYPKLPFLSGALGVKASVKLGEHKEISTAAIDLTNAEVKLDILNWVKPDKEPAGIDLTAEKTNGLVSIPSFHLKAKDADAEGSAALNAELTDFQRISAEKLHIGYTSLEHLHYERIDGGMRLEAGGKSADITYWLGGGNDNENTTFSFQDFPAIQMKTDISRLRMGEGREVSAFKGELTCDTRRCTSADMQGKTDDDKPFTLRIMRNPKGQRQFSMRAESAGAFLRAFHVFDGIQGGDLAITGDYEDSGSLKGRLDITEYTIKDAPVLAKMLSLASLTGFFDTLQGKGIHFVKFRAPFTLANNVITIDDARTYGAAVGITIDGTITYPQKILDLKGTLVPSYTLNSAVGKIPLVGAILTGGEGKGVFAASYKVKGVTNNPEVSVNPLSILTPGFLRGFFDGFETKK